MLDSIMAEYAHHLQKVIETQFVGFIKYVLMNYPYTNLHLLLGIDDVSRDVVAYCPRYA